MNRLITQILDRFSEIGITMYLVGGAVRDIIMNKVPKDLDFTTHLDNAGVKYYLTEDGVGDWYDGIYKINKQHLTQVVRYKDDDGNLHDLEITQFRIDAQTDGRHAQCIGTTSIKKDLERRDFTINAIAYSHETKSYIDPFKGEQDIKNKILRCVGNPWDRFQEDELRVLRLFRFEARLGADWTIEQDTLDAAMAYKMENISMERIRDEISKVFGDPNADCELFLDRLYEHGVLKRCLPQLWASDKNGNTVFCDKLIQTPKHHPEGDVWTHIKMVVQAATGVWGRWIALLHDIAKPCTAEWDALGKGNQWYSFHGHDRVGAEIIPDIVKHLRLEKQLGKIAAVCTRWHMDIYKFCNNVGKKDGGKVITGPKAKRVREVQSDFAKHNVPLHYMEDLAKADHMGRPLVEGVDEFWTPLPKEQTKRALSGYDVMAADNTVKPGLELKEMLDAAYRYQLKHGITDTVELLSVALNYKKEGK